MDGLKKTLKRKLNASSITEVIVATTILLVVFAIALVTLSNIMMSSVQKDSQALDTRIEKLIYQYKNKQIKAPVSYTKENLLISIEKVTQNEIECIAFSITHIVSKKKSIKRIIAIKNEGN
jgi:predicted PurR-regulated permease PerM